MNRIDLLDMLKAQFKLSKNGCNDDHTAYIDVAYELLYVFDTLVTGSTIEYEDYKHDAILGLAEYVTKHIGG